jgi:hypothetical protein
MEAQEQNREAMRSDKESREENLFTRDNSNDLSSGPLVEAADDNDDEDYDERRTDEDDAHADDE